MVKRFLQNSGVDFYENFSLVIKASVILTFAVSRGWEIRQVDINNAFLNGEFEAVVYINQPGGFIDSSKPSHVY